MTYEEYSRQLAAQGKRYDPRVGRVVTVNEFEQNHAGDNGNWLAKALAIGAPFIAGGIGALAGGGAGAAGAAAGSAAPSVGATGGLAAGAFPTVAGTAGAGAAGAGGGFMAGFGIKDALSLASIVPALFGGRGSSGDVPHSDAMEELLGLQANRLKQSDPLYQAVLRMAMGLMPVSARGGMPMPGGPSAMPAPQPGMQAVPRRMR